MASTTKDPAQHIKHPQSSEATTTLFIGNLSPNTSEEALRQHFRKYTNEIKVLLPKNEGSRKSHGFGYVGFSTVGIAQEVFEAESDKPIDGSVVLLDFVYPIWTKSELTSPEDLSPQSTSAPGGI